VNNLAVVAAIAAIEDRDFQQQTWDWLTAARQDLWQGLANFPQLQPQTSAANFLLVQSQSSCLPLQEALLKYHRIFIRDCLSFPELGSNYFRVKFVGGVRIQETGDRRQLSGNGFSIRLNLIIKN